MLIVIASLRTDADKRTALIELGQELARASRTEDGCLGYDVYVDSEDSDQLLIVERWADQVSVDAHRDTPHVKTFMSSVGRLVVGRGALIRAVAT